MALDKALDSILNTGSKVKILRLFISRREDFMATGRQIARLIKITAPAVHAALKKLRDQDILKQNIIGRQHIYSLNINSRIVKNILIPAFKKEHSFKRDVSDFIRKKIVEKKIKDKIVSVLLYGSLQTNATDEKSDVDIAIITKNKTAKDSIEEKFTIEEIAGQFYDYFGVHLDIYLKTKNDFIERFKKNKPPVSTLMKSYSAIYGKDPIDLR